MNLRVTNAITSFFLHYQYVLSNCECYFGSTQHHKSFSQSKYKVSLSKCYSNLEIVFSRLMSVFLDFLITDILLSVSTSFCPVVLIWACATGTPLVSVFLSSQGQNEGTPSQKWGIQFYSLKIIGLCSIKAQWSSFELAAAVFFFFYLASFTSKCTAQSLQK